MRILINIIMSIILLFIALIFISYFFLGTDADKEIKKASIEIQNNCESYKNCKLGSYSKSRKISQIIISQDDFCISGGAWFDDYTKACGGINKQIALSATTNEQTKYQIFDNKNNKWLDISYEQFLKISNIK